METFIFEFVTCNMFLSCIFYLFIFATCLCCNAHVGLALSFRRHCHQSALYLLAECVCSENLFCTFRSFSDMDPVDVPSTGGNKWLVNKKNRGWRRRVHLRKTANQPPTMQSEDKQGPKTIAEEWQKSGAWASSKKPPQAAQQRPNADENPLRFMCSLCRDSAEYIPKDLVGHFKEKHRGSPPVFCCQRCTFSTHEFSYLQVHLLSHKNTFSSCALCKDNIQRTWSEFKTHLTAYHFQNGKYSCQICPKFSTGDVGLFLEHTYAHSLTLEGTKDDMHAKEKAKFVLKATAPTLRCQHCGYEVSRKLLINNDIQAVHICSTDSLKKEGVCPAIMKPKKQLRLTRSAVREMCWLTQDCLSLPGREFLDKYCHLSDPQTTLEETQEFLMKSVARETADPKWTKALQSVLSNVPQEINLHPKSEKGVVSNSSDLAVLTVENKITVAQNSAPYCKNVKMMSSVEKTAVPAADITDEGPGQNGRQSDLGGANDRGNSVSGLSAPPGRKSAKNRKKRQNVRRKRRVRGKKGDKVAGLPLKIVLKKNPVKEKQWVSQSCEGGPDRLPGQAGLHATPKEMVQQTKASEPDSLEHCKTISGTPQVEPEGSSRADAGLWLEDSLQVLPVDAGLSRLAAEAGRCDAELSSVSTLPRRSGSCGVDFLTSGNPKSPVADGGTACSSSTKSAPSQLLITLQGETHNYRFYTKKECLKCLVLFLLRLLG